MGLIFSIYSDKVKIAVYQKKESEKNAYGRE